MQAYSDIEREDDAYSLPDIEVFFVEPSEFLEPDTCWAQLLEDSDSTPKQLSGYYYWACFPGCLPDSDPIGPFETEEEALADARDDV